MRTMKFKQGGGMKSGLPGNIPPVNQTRANYDGIKSRFPNNIVTQSYLRLEQEVTGTVSAINFLTLQQEGSILSTERRLNFPDIFVMTGYGMFISKAGSSTTSTPAAHAKKILRTFPNPQVFSASNEASNFMALYNGYFTLRIGTTTFIDSDHAYDFYNAGNYQKGVGSAAVSNVPVQEDQMNGLVNGYKSVSPTVDLKGNEKIQWLLTLPSATDLTGTSSFNTVSLIIKGFLVQNGVTKG